VAGAAWAVPLLLVEVFGPDAAAAAGGDAELLEPQPPARRQIAPVNASAITRFNDGLIALSSLGTTGRGDYTRSRRSRRCGARSSASSRGLGQILHRARIESRPRHPWTVRSNVAQVAVVGTACDWVNAGTTNPTAAADRGHQPPVSL